MKVIVKNVTGSLTEEAEMRESGVLIFKDGRISHVMHEKNFNKEITVYSEPVEAPAPVLKMVKKNK